MAILDQFGREARIETSRNFGFVLPLPKQPREDPGGSAHAVSSMQIQVEDEVQDGVETCSR